MPSTINNNTNNSNNSFIAPIDPVQALVEYINDVKPYHSKVVEVNVNYTHTEQANTTMMEVLTTTWSISINSVAASLGGNIVLLVSGDETQTLSAGMLVTLQGVAGVLDGDYGVTNVSVVTTQTEITLDAPLLVPPGNLGGVLIYTTQIV